MIIVIVIITIIMICMDKFAKTLDIFATSI